MKETLRALVELQDLEDSLRDLRRMTQKLGQLRQENQDTRELFEGMLASRNAQLDDIRGFCKEKEAEIKAAEEVARRARTRLSNIQSQRELTALNKELDTARRNNSQKSEELLKLMEQLETATADYEKKTNDFKELEQHMADAEKALETGIQEGEADSGAQASRREELRAVVDKPTLSRFDRVLAGRDGIAVANVKDNTCLACQMAVAPQTVIRLMRMETLESCTNCRRILVMRDTLFEPVQGVEAEEVVADA